MNKKRKLLKRIFALVGVVVVLVTAFVFPASASTVDVPYKATDIPFYNYFNCGAFSPTADIGSRQDVAQITEVDVNTGCIFLYTNFDGTHSPYIPTSYSNVTLASACPEMVVGETYVLSMDLGDFTNVVGEFAVELFPVIVLKRDGYSDVRWDAGKPLTITAEMLDAKIVLYSCRGDGTGRPTEFNSSLRIWINKDEAYKFCSYNYFVTLNEEAYNDGYLDGRESVLKRQYISKENTSLRLFYEDWDGVDLEYSYDTLYTSPLNMTGTYVSTFGCDGVISEHKNPASGRDYKVGYLELDIALDDYYVDNTLNTQFSVSWGPHLNSNICSIYARNPSDGIDRRYTTDLGYHYKADDDIPADSKLNPTLRSVDISWSYFGITEGMQITRVVIKVPVMRNGFESAIGPDGGPLWYHPYAGISFSVGAIDDYSFEAGKTEGINEGRDLGYDEGYTAGINANYADIKNKIYKEAYNSGYTKGRADEQDEGTFFTLIYSVLDAPVKVLGNVLNFEIMGVNMMGLASSLITFAIIVTVVKYFV